MAKFRHFDEIFNRLMQFLRVHSVFGEYFGKGLKLFGTFPLGNVKGQILKNLLAIWSTCGRRLFVT